MPALPRDALALVRAWRNAELDMLRLRIRLGRMAVRLKDTPSLDAQGVPALAHAAGLSEGTVYRFAQIAEAWSDDELEELILGRTAPALAWSHLIELCRVTSEAHRARLTNEARKHGWSTRELRRRVHQLVGKFGAS